MKKLWTLFLILLVLLTNCKSEPESHNGPIQDIQEIKTAAPFKIVKEKEINLNNQTGVDPVPKLLALPDKLLVFHFEAPGAQKKKVFCDAYSHQLEWLWRKEFYAGQGPGDIVPACRVFFINNLIYCLEYRYKRISIFDSEMNLQRITQAQFANGDSAISQDGGYFYWTSLAKGNKDMTLWKTKVSGNEKEKLAYFGPFSGSRYDNGNQKILLKSLPDRIIFSRENHVFFLNCKTYTINRVHITGTLDRAIHYIVPEITLSKNEKERNLAALLKSYNIPSHRKSRFALASFVQPASGVACLANGFVVLRRENYNPIYPKTIEGDYFTYDLVPKGKVQFPSFIDCGNKYGLNTQQPYKNGIYLVQQAPEDHESDTLTYYKIVE